MQSNSVTETQADVVENVATTREFRHTLNIDRPKLD